MCIRDRYICAFAFPHAAKYKYASASPHAEIHRNASPSPHAQKYGMWCICICLLGLPVRPYVLTRVCMGTRVCMNIQIFIAVAPTVGHLADRQETSDRCPTDARQTLDKMFRRSSTDVQSMSAGHLQDL